MRDEPQLDSPATPPLRVKYRCISVTKAQSFRRDAPHGFVYTARFEVVRQGSPENDAFFAQTPCGDLSIGLYKADAFEPGREYYLDLRLAR